jgi:hypothetical protein
MNQIKRVPRIPVWYVVLIILAAGLWLGAVQAAPLVFGARGSVPATASAPTAAPTACHYGRGQAGVFERPNHHWGWRWGWAGNARPAARPAAPAWASNPRFQACFGTAAIWHPWMFHR